MAAIIGATAWYAYRQIQELRRTRQVALISAIELILRYRASPEMVQLRSEIEENWKEIKDILDPKEKSNELYAG